MRSRSTNPAHGPSNSPWPEQLTVDAVDPTTGTLTMTPRPAVDPITVTAQLRSPKVYGLHWRGGFAQSAGPALTSSGAALTSNGDALKSNGGGTGSVHGADSGDSGNSGGQLTRTATLIEGDWPTPGDLIGVHSFAYPQGTEPPWQTITFEGADGPLQATFAPAEPITTGQPASATKSPTSAITWAIMVHGKGSEPDEFDRVMPTFASHGIPSLAIHYRGDPGMPPATNGRYGFGATEWPDLAAAVDYARAEGAQRVILVGASMGGAIVASYLRHAPDSSMVVGVVLDSPALSLSRTIEFGADQIALPGGLSLPAPVTWGAQRLASLRFGLDWDAVDYVTDPAWATMPTLIFHGTDDATVPIATSRELAAARDTVTFVETAGADHVESWNVDPSAYDRALSRFVTALDSRP